MAFKMNGFSGFRDKMRVKKAKRLIRKNVWDTTYSDVPTIPNNPNISEKKFNKADKKISKATKLLAKAGYGPGEIEKATGSEGYEVAMEFAKKKKK